MIKVFRENGKNGNNVQFSRISVKNVRIFAVSFFTLICCRMFVLFFLLSRGPFLSFFVLYEENHMFLTVCDGSVINGQL